VFTRFSVTPLVLPTEVCDTTFWAVSESDQSHLKAAPVPRNSGRFSSQYCPHPATETFLRPTFSRTPKAASVIYQKLQTVAPRIRKKKHMAAFRIAAQVIAHQAVEAVEVFPHVRRASRNIYPRRRSKPEHLYTLSNTVSRRSNVSASNPRRTSIRRRFATQQTEHRRTRRRCRHPAPSREPLQRE